MAQDDDVFVVGVKLTRPQLAAMLDEVSGQLDFELKIKVSKKQLGNVLAALPPKVNPQIDRLVERDFALLPKLGRPLGGDDYRPTPGTAPYAIMEVMNRGPVPGAAAVANQLAGRFHERAVNTSFYQLRDRGWLKKLPDGRYGLGPKAPQPAKPKPNPKPAAKKKPAKPSTPKVVAESKANGAGAEA
jgi:hypothetical protein